MKNKKSFTVEDFEKGLMLLGYVMPSSIEDLQEIESIGLAEKKEAEERKKTYFKRVVLAAEIASKLHNEPTLGRVKFQKIVYLCEYAAEMHLASHYQKQTAGPFDNKFMHTIANEFRKNNWFEIQEVVSNGMKRTKYIPMPNVNGYKEYYDRYFAVLDESIQYIINLFRKENTSNTELAATVYACILELVTANKEVTKQALTELFYGWSEAKNKFSETAILNSAHWLKEKNLITIDVTP